MGAGPEECFSARSRITVSSNFPSKDPSQLLSLGVHELARGVKCMLHKPDDPEGGGRERTPKGCPPTTTP